MISEFYILEDRIPVAVSDIFIWSEWFNNADNRRVAVTVIDGVTVSTVFLGVAHSFRMGKPLLFETIVFGGRLDGVQRRCGSWQEAEQQHRAYLSSVAADKRACLCRFVKFNFYFSVLLAVAAVCLGFRDILNPCPVIICAVLSVGLLYLSRRQRAKMQAISRVVDDYSTKIKVS